MSYLKHDKCKHLSFGYDNYIEGGEIVCTPEPVTDVDWLKTSDREEQARWTNLEGNIVIETTLPAPVFAEYFAILGNNLKKDAKIKVEVFENVGDTEPTFQTDWETIGKVKPLGLWRAGIDTYGELQEPNGLDNVQVIWFDKLRKVTFVRLTIDHGYSVEAPVDNSEPTTIITSDGIPKQTNGIVSIEAENGVVTDSGIDTWAQQSQSGASGGNALYKSGSEFYGSSGDGPRVKFRFTPVATGTLDVWVRMESTDGNSFYSLFNDSQSKTHIYDVSVFRNVGWKWHKIRSVYTVGQNVSSITIAARDHYLSFDKIVLQPAGSAAPTGEGPAESPHGTITTTIAGEPIMTSTDNVTLRMITLGNIITLEENFNYGAVLKLLTEPEIRYTSSGYAVNTKIQRYSRSMQLVLDAMTDNDRLVLSDLETKLMGKPFLITAYPKRAKWFTDHHMFLGIFGNALPYSHFFEDINQTQLTVLET